MAWKGSKKTVAISAGSLDTIDTVKIQDGATYMWAEIANGAGGKLDAFELSFQPASDASFHVIANTASEFTTAVAEPVLGSTIDFTTLPVSTAGMLRLLVKGAYQVRFKASCTASSDTTVNLRWQVR